MSIIGKFFAAIRRQHAKNTVEQEIYSQIIPQIKGLAHHGYPFNSDDELQQERRRMAIQLWDTLRGLDSKGLSMPEREGNALLYVAYREMNERLRLYREIAQAKEVYRLTTPASIASAA